MNCIKIRYVFFVFFLMGFQVARFLMKTVSQLGSGKSPAGTTEYMGRAQHLLKCRSNVRKGDFPKNL